jgi:hypothetical protein
MYSMSAIGHQDGAYKSVLDIMCSTGASWGPSNYHTKIEFWTTADGDTSRNVKFAVDGSDIRFNAYGIGNKSGTPAYNLQVDATGKIIETTAQATQVQNNNVTTFYDDDADAAVGGIAVGELYALSASNTYTLPSGMVKVRFA